MKRYQANATKPRPVNSSKNIDVAKRNFSGEVTVTVPITEDWSGVISVYDVAQNGNIVMNTDVHTRSVMAMIAESKLMQNLNECFDNCKIIDSHFCIDVTKPPEVQVPLKGVIQNLTIRFCELDGNGNDGNWITLPQTIFGDENLNNIDSRYTKFLATGKTMQDFCNAYPGNGYRWL